MPSFVRTRRTSRFNAASANPGGSKSIERPKLSAQWSKLATVHMASSSTAPD
jgi:hypothetical protein